MATPAKKRKSVSRKNPGDGYVESTIRTPKKRPRMTPIYVEGSSGRGPSGNWVYTKEGKTTKVSRPGGRGQTVTESYASVPKRGKSYSKTTTTSARISRLGSEGPKKRTPAKKTVARKKK